MAETNQRRTVIKALAGLDPIAVENPAYPGTPDVNYVNGWIELKWLRQWPKRDSTVVAIDHFTQQQRVWLQRRWKKAGPCFLLLQVRREWLLFTGDVAADIVGRVDREALTLKATKYWSSGLMPLDLQAFLKSYN